jgi:hypothetical protein
MKGRSRKRGKHKLCLIANVSNREAKERPDAVLPAATALPADGANIGSTAPHGKK